VLQPRDLALFYTDGITEARSPAGEFFAIGRLDQTLCDLANPITPDLAIRAVTRAVTDFESDASQADDQTLLALGACLH